MAVYRLTLNWGYLFQNCANVGHYETTDPAATAKDLAESFWSTFAGVLTAQASTAVTFIDVEVINLNDPNDWHKESLGNPGLRAGSDIAPFLAVGIRLDRQDRSIRPGSKRIGGVLETDVADGGTLEPIIVPTYQAVADAWSSDVTGSTLIVYNCVVLHRPTPNDPNQRTTAVIDGVLTGLTTQNSRKAGR